MSICHTLVGSPIPWVSMPCHGMFAFGHGACQTRALVVMPACISIVNCAAGTFTVIVQYVSEGYLSSFYHGDSQSPYSIGYTGVPYMQPFISGF